MDRKLDEERASRAEPGEVIEHDLYIETEREARSLLETLDYGSGLGLIETMGLEEVHRRAGDYYSRKFSGLPLAGGYSDVDGSLVIKAEETDKVKKLAEHTASFAGRFTKAKRAAKHIVRNWPGDLISTSRGDGYEAVLIKTH